MIEYKNLTTGEIGNVTTDALPGWVAGLGDSEVVAWSDSDDHALCTLTGGRERSPAELLALVTWLADGDDDYLILTDSELDEYADERLESYLNDCVLDQIPENLRGYFDSAAWKRDAIMSDGVLHCARLAEVSEIAGVAVGSLYTQA